VDVANVLQHVVMNALYGFFRVVCKVGAGKTDRDIYAWWMEQGHRRLFSSPINGAQRKRINRACEDGWRLAPCLLVLMFSCSGSMR